MNHVINWFEIPVTDMQRATEFYSKMLNVSLAATDFQGTPMVFFPAENGAVTGALIQEKGAEPGVNGPTIYFNRGKEVAATLERAVAAGAKTLVPTTTISEEVGEFAVFIDSEGNKIGLFGRP